MVVCVIVFFPFYRILLRSFCFRLYKMYLCGQRSTIPNCAFDLLFDLFFLFSFVFILWMQFLLCDLWYKTSWMHMWYDGKSVQIGKIECYFEREKKTTKQLQSKLLKLLLLLHKIAVGYCPFVVFFFVHISVICIAMHTVTAVVFHFLNSCLFLF